MPSVPTMSNWFATNNPPVCSQIHLVWDHSVHWLQFIFPKSQSNTLLCLVTVLLWLKNSSLNLKAYKLRVVMNYFVGNWLEHQAHPTTVFCKIRVRSSRSKYCLEFFLLKVWHQTSDIRQLKSDVWQQTPADIRWPFFMYNFQSFSNKSATTCWSLIFHILLPMQVRLFFAVKRKSKIFGKVILEP